MRSAPRLLDLSSRAYRWLLWIVPAGLRARRGDEMVELFRDQLHAVYRDRGVTGAVGVWARALVGIASVRLAGDASPPAALPPVPERDGPMRRIADDFRQAGRSLRRSPSFATICIATLGLGIGATTAIFSLVHAVLIEPLTYPESDRIFFLDHAAPGLGFDSGLNSAPGLHVHYADHAQELESIGYWRLVPIPLTGVGDPERVGGAEATSGVFVTLGTRPLHGRLFGEADDAHDGERTAILSHELWQRRYGGDPGIVGSTIEIGGRPVPVVGVLPSDFIAPSRDIELWLDNTWDDRGNFGGFSVRGIGRLRNGASRESLKAELDALIGAIDRTFPDDDVARVLAEAGVAALPEPLKERWVGSIRNTLWILLGSVGFVLAVACANVANLFLVRSESRQRETAVRSALGAGRGQLARMFLAESLLMGVAAGGVGLALAVAGTRALVRTAPVTIPRLAEVDVDLAVLGCAATLALLTGLLFGSVPSLRRHGSVSESLRDGGRASTAGRLRARSRQLLVGAQVALALVLLVGAGLMARSFWQIRSVEPGFEAEGLLAFELGLPGGRYPTEADAASFHRRLLDRLATLPGVVATAAIAELPLEGLMNGNFVAREDAPLPVGKLPPLGWLNRATSGIFETLGMPLRSGRPLERADFDDRRPVVVINEAAQRVFWQGADPLGSRISVGVLEAGEETQWLTVVGVVGDTLQRDLVTPTEPMIYIPMDVGPDDAGQSYTLSYAIRTQVPPLNLASAVRETIWQMDPGLPVVRLGTMASRVEVARAPAAFTLALLGIAAAVAVLLGSVGVYGVVSWVVRRRTAEIGIRMALGARAGDVVRMMLVHGGGVAGAGLAVGLAGSWFLAGSLEAMLYEVRPLDPWTHSVVVVLLMSIVLVATWIPARRAARVDPLRSLRTD